MLYDLSPRLDAETPVWPGDTPLRREVLMELERGDPITLSTLRSTVHVGSHADAPSHYAEDGSTIDRMDPERYLGRCLLLDVAVARRERVAAGKIPTTPLPPRVLLRTRSWDRDRRPFDEGFAGLSEACIEALADRGVRLIGVDTPSVDLFPSKRLPAHRTCHRRDVAIVEGLVLDGVPAVEGELICLPLNLVGFDASPVRALFRTEG